MSPNEPAAHAFAAIVIDSDNGTTALHQAATKGNLKNLCGISVEFLATVNNSRGQTPLHTAASYGHLDQISGVTADLLATVKNNHGKTPLHLAIENRHLAQIGNLTIKLAEELKLINETLHSQNIFVFTEDFRRHGAAYNKRNPQGAASNGPCAPTPNGDPTQRCKSHPLRSPGRRVYVDAQSDRQAPINQPQNTRPCRTSNRRRKASLRAALNNTPTPPRPRRHRACSRLDGHRQQPVNPPLPAGC